MSSIPHFVYPLSTFTFYTSIKGRDAHLCLFYITSRISFQPHHTPFSTTQHLLYVLLVVQTALPAIHYNPATIPSPSTCRGRPPCLPEQQLTTTANKQQQNNLPSIAGRHGGLPLHEEGAVSMKEPRGVTSLERYSVPLGGRQGGFRRRQGG